MRIGFITQSNFDVLCTHQRLNIILAECRNSSRASAATAEIRSNIDVILNNIHRIRKKKQTKHNNGKQRYSNGKYSLLLTSAAEVEKKERTKGRKLNAMRFSIPPPQPQQTSQTKQYPSNKTMYIIYIYINTLISVY